ncbi:MAG TPA: ATP-dependent sacrificial sulfur transferase LarE, partial [Candidatus Wallbacteria bacterium]|nr:ATP-dependent sacrificial sulfur transferase LarE [Candidatus Wallbacteria bacterium]
MANFDFSKIDKKSALEKLDELKNIIKSCGSALIAYSGGVDSSFLAAVSKEVLGPSVILATAISETFPRHESEISKKFAAELGIEQIFIESSELDIDEFRKNPKNRCYFCKKELFTKFLKLADDKNISKVFSGANFDDLDDFRPGLAAQKELGIMSPLMEAKLTKLEIRWLSKDMGLSSWDRPQMACLTSRFPYGVEFSKDKFNMVEICEDKLREIGFSQYRVRCHDEVARIEIEPSEFELLIKNRENISAGFKKAGFKFVTIDIDGFRS